VRGQRAGNLCQRRAGCEGMCLFFNGSFDLWVAVVGNFNQ
jgi:hypothetical protein